MFIIQPKHFLDGLSTIIGQFCKTSSLIHAIQMISKLFSIISTHVSFYGVWTGKDGASGR